MAGAPARGEDHISLPSATKSVELATVSDPDRGRPGVGIRRYLFPGSGFPRRARELGMLIFVIRRVISLLLTVLRVSYRALIGSLVVPGKTQHTHEVTITGEDGAVEVLVGCQLADRAHSLAEKALNRANASYTHSSRTKTALEQAGEPDTVAEWLDQAPTQPANGTQHYGVGQRTRSQSH